MTHEVFGSTEGFVKLQKRQAREIMSFCFNWLDSFFFLEFEAPGAERINVGRPPRTETHFLDYFYINTVVLCKLLLTNKNKEVNSFILILIKF